MAGPLKETNVNEYGSQQLTSTTETLHLVTPTLLVWRREVPIDSDALIAANDTKGAIEFDPTSTTIPNEAEWVKLDEATGEGVLSESGDWGYCVFAGRTRLDVPGSSGITVLCGPQYVAETTNFISGTEDAAFGAPLYIVNAGTTNSLTSVAPGGTNYAVARFEGYVTRKGALYIRFHSIE